MISFSAMSIEPEGIEFLESRNITLPSGVHAELTFFIAPVDDGLHLDATYETQPIPDEYTFYDEDINYLYENMLRELAIQNQATEIGMHICDFDAYSCIHCLFEKDNNWNKRCWIDKE